MQFEQIPFGWAVTPPQADEDGPRGFGRTRKGAVIDLISGLTGDCDPALDDALAQLREIAIENARAIGRSDQYVAGLTNGFSAVMNAVRGAE